MLTYLLRRLLFAIPLLFLVAVVSFIIIELPPGDYLTVYVMNLKQSGEAIDEAALQVLRARYGLDKPILVRFFIWLKGVLKGDFGYSFMWEKPVSELIGPRLWYTVLISVLSTVFAWVFGFLIGVYSGIHQYSIGDYTFTVLGYIGLATPNFLLALILLWGVYVTFGVSLGGLFSPEYANAPWSWAKFVDLLKHIWLPVIVIGTGSMAGLIRILRANLLDEIEKPYVLAARARGVPSKELYWKYPLRVAVIPFASTAGWVLPEIVSGAVVTGIVLNLPTVGVILLDALQSQDMYLAGSLVMFLSIFTIIGTIISDIILAWLDPRIRFE